MLNLKTPHSVVACAFAIPLLFVSLGGFPCFAQTAALAQVSGTVRDPTGASIAGAQIRLTQIETKLERQITSDGEGRYSVPALPIGPYELEAVAGGFKTYVQSGIILQVGNNVEINVSLQLGSASEHVDVQAQAAMVETRDNTISQVIDERRISELPLNGRQLTQLILLSGAAVSTPAPNLVTSKNFYSSVAISVAGGQANSVNYMLDGGDNNDAFTNLNLPIPFPDALQEFSVQTSSLPARFGLHPAAVVNAVTKSGTNDWHGDLFEFLRNGDLNARNFFAPAHDSLKRNQFGGTFGDRIIRDKLFIFGGFQGTFNRSNPPQTISYVPTAAVLNGDFSVIDGSGCIAGGVAKAVIDPSTGAPFPGNQIPVSRFDKASLALVKYLPQAQTPCGRTTYGIVTTGDDDQEVVRMDWVQSATSNIFGRYYIVDYRNPAVFDGKNILTTSQAGNLERAQSATIGNIHTFNGTLVNSAHATFTRRRDDRGPAPNVPNPTDLGINAPSPLASGFTALVSGYFSVGCASCTAATFNVNSLSFFDDVDVVRGKHQMAFGVNVNRNQFNSFNPLFSNGQSSFTGQYATGKSTDALAAFLLGAMSDYEQSGYQQNATRQTVVGLYAQDSIRLTSHLTVNLGIRWDPALVPHDYFNSGASFSQANFNAGIRSSIYPNAPAGLLFYGDQGIPQGFQHNDLALFSPRLGIVWDPTGSGRQTIRVSSAILRDTQELYYNQKLTANPPNASTVDRPFPFQSGGTFSNPWGGYPGGSPFPLPSPVPSTFVFPTGATYTVLPLNIKPMYMAQWSLSYQRQITANWLASVTYLGNKTTHVLSAEDSNPAVYIPGSSAGTNLRRRLYLQNPTLGAPYGQVVQSDPNGNSNYNAILLSIQHRFNHGFTWLSNYTWSHCLSDVDHNRDVGQSEYEDPYDRALDYGNCNFDIRHQMNTSLIVISPAKGNSLAGRVLGQWQLSPIVSVRAGLPLNITDGTDISQTGINLDRPNLVLPNASPNSTNPLVYINSAAFKNQAPGTFGNLGRNVLIGPGALNFDVALTRTFRFRERWQITPRAEAFNVINHTNFGVPNTVLTSSQFGMITGSSISGTTGAANNLASAGDPRILQFALKLQF